MTIRAQYYNKMGSTIYYNSVPCGKRETIACENNFFGMSDVQKHAFTMTSIADAITLRNHIINILEQANLDEANTSLRKSLLTFIVVGGGFNGIETIGELNHFVREGIKKYYKNILMTDVRSVVHLTRYWNR
jgi:NADH:quinone reductase (non-electrogenic)